MGKSYKSKIGLELVVPLVLVLGFCTFMMVYGKSWIGSIVFLLIDGYFIYSFWAFRYEINENNLRIHFGGFYIQKISVETIRKIVETKSILSAPALSFDRLEIIYNKFDSVLISPKNKKEFIVHLTKLSPKIEVKLKKKKRLTHNS